MKTTLSGSLPKRNLLAHILLLQWLKKSTIVEIIALLFVILFLYTGISKLMDHSVFKEQLAESPVLEPIAPLIAWGLPIAEIILSILLFLPKFRRKGLYAATALMVIFTVYIIVVLTFSDELPCSCGGVLEQLSWPTHIVFNCVFIALGVIGILVGRRLYNN